MSTEHSISNSFKSPQLVFTHLVVIGDDTLISADFDTAFCVSLGTKLYAGCNFGV